MDLGKLLKQAQEVQGRMQAAQEEISNLVVTGVAGGGLVKIDMKGQHEVQTVQIDNSVVKVDEKDILEDLLVAAFNDAVSKVEGETKSRMKGLSEGLDLPEGLELPTDED